MSNQEKLSRKYKYCLKRANLKYLNVRKFNSEIESLFEFINNINFELKFKEEFKILKVEKKYDLKNLDAAINDFDQEELLDFFTKNSENDSTKKKDESCRDPAYFLNTLEPEYSFSDDIFTKFKKSLNFIKNKNIKEYFLNMTCIAYSGDFEKFKSCVLSSNQKRKCETFDLQPREKFIRASELNFDGYESHQNNDHDDSIENNDDTSQIKSECYGGEEELDIEESFELDIKKE